MATAAEPVLYLDASALVKLVVEEPESGALGRALADTALVSSELVLAEVPRAINRLRSGRTAREHQGLTEGTEAVLRAIALVPVARDVLLAAGSFREAFLRTLGTVHVASALAVADELAAFVTYDERQAEVAEYAGFPVLAPAGG